MVLPIPGQKYGTELETTWEPTLVSPPVPACARELIFSRGFLFVLVLVFCFGLFSLYNHRCSLEEQETYKTPCHAVTTRVSQLGQAHISGRKHSWDGRARGSFSCRAQSNPVPAPLSRAGSGSQVPSALPAAPGQSDTGTNGLNQPVSAWEKSGNNFQLRTKMCRRGADSWSC